MTTLYTKLLDMPEYQDPDVLAEMKDPPCSTDYWIEEEREFLLGEPRVFVSNQEFFSCGLLDATPHNPKTENIFKELQSYVADRSDVEITRGCVLPASVRFKIKYFDCAEFTSARRNWINLYEETKYIVERMQST